MPKPPSKHPAKKSNQHQISEFLTQAGQLQVQAKEVSGRLIFAIDATASRQPSWDRASQLQAEMFQATKHAGIGEGKHKGGLAVQLCYYRGLNEFHYTPWCFESETLLTEMTRVQCLGGYTQIKKVLAHAIEENKQHKLNALVFIGDALEENIDQLCQLAGKLGILQCPIFIFQEGYDAGVAKAFTQIAHLSGGAYHAFNESSADELAALLSAVAVYATGGKEALLDYVQTTSASSAKLLLEQLAK